MQLQSLVVLAISAATIANAFTVPTNQPAGVYSVTSNSDGSKTHNRVGGPKKARSTTTRHEVNRRDAVGAECSSDGLLGSDISAATAALAAQCGDDATVNGQMDFYSISGGVVAYYCSFTNSATLCSASSANAAFNNVKAVCPNTGGWLTQPTYSYGFERIGSEFCSRGTG